MERNVEYENLLAQFTVTEDDDCGWAIRHSYYRNLPLNPTKGPAAYCADIAWGWLRMQSYEDLQGLALRAYRASKEETLSTVAEFSDGNTFHYVLKDSRARAGEGYCIYRYFMVSHIWHLSYDATDVTASRAFLTLSELLK